MAFPSVYEMNNLLTTVRKQHFWEYFSGATLNSRWTTHYSVANGTITPSTTADGGMVFTTAGNTYSDMRITFNGKKQFSATDSTVIGVWKSSDTTSNASTRCGLTTDSNLGAETQKKYASVLQESQSVYQIEVGNGGTHYHTDSTFNKDHSFHIHKLERTTSGGIKLSIDGTQVADRTSNVPTGTDGLQPSFTAGTGSGSSHVGAIKYMECYNT